VSGPPYGEAVREIVYRLERQQTRNMRALTAGLLVATVALIVASVVAGGPWWLVAVFTGLFAVVLGIIWYGQVGAFTRLDDAGITACVFTGFRREAAWPDIDQIAIRSGNRDQAIVVGLRDGRHFTLAAPLNSAMFPDPHFMRKFSDIHDAWTSADHPA
jgi:hypothetical protein